MRQELDNYRRHHNHRQRRRYNDYRPCERSLVNLPWEIICNILSRLPLSLLTRCKTISKSVYNLHQEPYFIDMQFNNAKKTYILLRRHNPRGLTNLYFMEEQKNGRWQVTRIPFNNDLKGKEMKIVASCNGVVCLCHTDTDSGRSVHFRSPIIIYHPVTRQIYTLPELNLRFPYMGNVSLGFDAENKKYKVFVIYDCDSGLKGHVHTVGESSWREFNVPSPSVREQEKDKSFFLDGDLYWVPSYCDQSILVADISNEKFSEIKYPFPYSTKVNGLIDFKKQLGLVTATGQIWYLVDKKREIWKQQIDTNKKGFRGLYDGIKVVGMAGDDNLLVQSHVIRCGKTPKNYLDICGLKSGKKSSDFFDGDIPDNFDVFPYVPSLASLKF